MRVIGTAGHVDHGKSTLVEAMTGTHPDRLKEEREREMTIDLGFAWVVLPDGEEIGIVDVPGHRDFIENMLAGVGGIDAVLFVVAADEGVMPQTREHLAILDILQIEGGVIALTKTDLVEDDTEWLDLVEGDVRQTLKGTVLEAAPIIRVSGKTGEGIGELMNSLSQCLTQYPAKPDLGKPRLPIDRVFSVSGFGTIVTGTLVEGKLHTGDELEILPPGLGGRVRGLQTHKREQDVAIPGSRTAVNISGISVDQVKRGYVVAHPGEYQTTRRLDVSFRLLPDASQSVKHNVEMKLYIGASDAVVRVRLLGKKDILPGEEGWLQLELDQEVVAERGDHYILRRPSPGETLGGGVVVDAHPQTRYKRFDQSTIERLKTLAGGSPLDVVKQIMLTAGYARLEEIFSRANISADSFNRALNDLIKKGQIIVVDDTEEILNLESNVLVSSNEYWEELTESILEDVEKYHKSFPLSLGIKREELKSRLNVPVDIFNKILGNLLSEKMIKEIRHFVCLPEHEIRFDSAQQQSVDALMSRFSASPFTPPSVKECISDVGERVYRALIDQENLVQVRATSSSSVVVFSKDGYNLMFEEVRELIEKQGSVSVAQVRDHFNTSRRVVLPFLEHLDVIGVTVRVGDERRLKQV